MEGVTYPKIETLFERDKKTFKVDPTQVRRWEFACISEDTWMFTEKIDGTNIRIRVTEDGSVEFGGRTAAAQLPANLLEVLNEEYAKDGEIVERIVAQIRAHGVKSLTLFGEGYGPKIQKGGGNYGETPKFILFDVLVDEKTWLQPEDVITSAANWGIDHVPVLNIPTVSDAIAIVQHGFQSTLSDKIEKCEGVVARPLLNLYDQRGNRVMWKLKTTDFHNPESRL